MVTNPRVPRLIRHSLNLESGLNDGLALPPVLGAHRGAGRRPGLRRGGRSSSRTSGSGFVFGVGIGLLASHVLPRERGLRTAIPEHQRAVRAGRRVPDLRRRRSLEPHGNGFIAVFVAAITLGIRRPDVRVTFERRAEDLVEIVKLGIFVVFGALLTFDRCSTTAGPRWRSCWSVARRAAGRRLARAARHPDRRAALAFMAWFGPKGVATMTFTLLVLAEGIGAGERDLRPRGARPSSSRSSRTG